MAYLLAQSKTGNYILQNKRYFKIYIVFYHLFLESLVKLKDNHGPKQTLILLIYFIFETLL